MVAPLEDVEIKVVQNEDEYVDSEEDISEAKVEEMIFVEEAEEPEEDDTSDSDDDDKQMEAEKPIEAESGASSSSKEPKAPKDNRDYMANLRENFIAVDLSMHP